MEAVVLLRTVIKSTCFHYTIKRRYIMGKQPTSRKAIKVGDTRIRICGNVVCERRSPTLNMFDTSILAVGCRSVSYKPRGLHIRRYIAFHLVRVPGSLAFAYSFVDEMRLFSHPENSGK